MASARSLKKPTKKEIQKRLMAVSDHPHDCRCKDAYCIKFRTLVRKWRKKFLPAIQAAESMSRLTAADLAIVINVRG